MKFLILLAALVLAAEATLTVNQKWVQFKTTHKKEYSNSVEERIRFAIFQDNVQEIEEHNKKFDQGLVSYKMGINQFSDLTHAEFLGTLSLKTNKPNTKTNAFKRPLNAKEPDTVDWRLNGSVTPVKNQGQCGSCWAFSATGTLEGQYQIKYNKLVPLSEQNLVDCAGGEYGNGGCSGGFMEGGFEYVRDHGINSEEDYPYDASDNTCKQIPEKNVLFVEDIFTIKEDDEDDLKSAVANVGPIAVAIDASYISTYVSGVYTDDRCSKDSLNHGVLAVGYGTENGKDYWLVKNSWGASWGDSGYIKMSRNAKNQCGIASDASYATVVEA